jgi:ABC-type branched-subunit amino acid transport system substrate-binding protein
MVRLFSKRRNEMKTKLIWLFVLIMAFGVLVACGGSDTTTEEPTTSAEVADTAVADAQATADAEVAAAEAEAAAAAAEAEDAAASAEATASAEAEAAAAAAEAEAMAEEEATPEPTEEPMEEDAMMACSEDLTGQTIVIHQQAGREGPLAAILGDGFAIATNDALQYINEHGGICGADLVVEFCETNYDVELEISCYEAARTEDPKPIILLSYGSAATIALKDRVVEDEVLHIVSGLNADALYDPSNGYTIAPFPIYSDQFAGFLQFVHDNWADIKPENAGDDIVVGVIGWANAFGAGATTPEALAFAESLGITVLPLEEQALSPEADVTGQLQNLLLGGANVIYNQNLSFSTTQVIGTLRALGVWDSVVTGTVNWGFNTDVISFLGDNAPVANGFYGVFPSLWYDDVDNETVALATMLIEENGHDDSVKGITHLSTISSFVLLEKLLEATIERVGYANLSGATLLETLEEMETLTDGVLTLDTTDGSRSTHEAQFRQMQWDGEKINFVVVQDWTTLPDTAPTGE